MTLAIERLCFSFLFGCRVVTNLVDVRDVKLRELASRLPQILEASKEKSTIKAYNCAFRQFKIWVQDFIELSYLPASSKSIFVYFGFNSAREVL